VSANGTIQGTNTTYNSCEIKAHERISLINASLCSKESKFQHGFILTSPGGEREKRTISCFLGQHKILLVIFAAVQQ